MEIRGTQLLSHSMAAGTGDSVPGDKEQGNDNHRTISRRGQSVAAKSGGAWAIRPGREASLGMMEIMTGVSVSVCVIHHDWSVCGQVTVLFGLLFLPLYNGGWWCPPHRALVRSKHINLCKD